MRVHGVKARRRATSPLLATPLASGGRPPRCARTALLPVAVAVMLLQVLGYLVFLRRSQSVAPAQDHAQAETAPSESEGLHEQAPQLNPTVATQEHARAGGGDAREILDCRDTSASCNAWALAGECVKNPDYMLEACPLSCDQCFYGGRDSHSQQDADQRTGSLTRVTLPCGLEMPAIGFGTAGLGGATTKAVTWALQGGYKLLDTAQAKEWYREDLVGEALAESGVDRASIFITTKQHPRDHGYKSTLRQVEASLEVCSNLATKGLPSQSQVMRAMQLQALRTDYIDLYMLHYPRCWGSLCSGSHAKQDPLDGETTWQEAWKAAEEAVRQGKVWKRLLSAPGDCSH
eukprot:scaffold841_cov397-Prasinococcus_capsulatus_cf.AAC.3